MLLTIYHSELDIDSNKTSIALGYSFQKIEYTDKPTNGKGDIYGNILIGIGYNFKIKQ